MNGDEGDEGKEEGCERDGKGGNSEVPGKGEEAGRDNGGTEEDEAAQKSPPARGLPPAPAVAAECEHVVPEWLRHGERINVMRNERKYGALFTSVVPGQLYIPPSPLPRNLRPQTQQRQKHKQTHTQRSSCRLYDARLNVPLVTARAAGTLIHSPRRRRLHGCWPTSPSIRHTGSSIADTAPPMVCVAQVYPHTGVSTHRCVLRFNSRGSIQVYPNLHATPGRRAHTEMGDGQTTQHGTWYSPLPSFEPSLALPPLPTTTHHPHSTAATMAAPRPRRATHNHITHSHSMRTTFDSLTAFLSLSTPSPAPHLAGPGPGLARVNISAHASGAVVLCGACAP
eukprot:scaffold11477_cov129-Isochrysis_galbana.AAC.1